ncbi:putative disease resistance protein [Vitis vinifera]|uniref:Putative disease resistance protein n=1 Tax=Vitis vinifera TaxID=29760 RepID=A0A438BQF2_VITVI|nr:putative disease resistance protein [Vitis vinifera]
MQSKRKTQGCVTGFSDIRDVAYDAEDVVDMFILKAEALRRKSLSARFPKAEEWAAIGKTNLAKKVYNHSRVVDHFQSCHEARKIEKFQENELGNFLHDQLKEKRFLVVLDDIWRSDDWKCLANAFPEESDGSRLLLTSRNKDVALQADAQKLKEFGKRMVKKCAGLPLAIVVLGGLLSSKKQLSTEWEKASSQKIRLSPQENLLLLWMAEGFIPQQDERRMEDTAEDYLNELISRNLVHGSNMGFDLEVSQFSNSIAKLENLRSLYLETPDQIEREILNPFQLETSSYPFSLDHSLNPYDFAASDPPSIRLLS